jgi:hypothetical protein
MTLLAKPYISPLPRTYYGIAISNRTGGAIEGLTVSVIGPDGVPLKQTSITTDSRGFYRLMVQEAIRPGSTFQFVGGECKHVQSLPLALSDTVTTSTLAALGLARFFHVFAHSLECS